MDKDTEEVIATYRYKLTAIKELPKLRKIFVGLNLIMCYDPNYKNGKMLPLKLKTNI